MAKIDLVINFNLSTLKSKIEQIIKEYQAYRFEAVFSEDEVRGLGLDFPIFLTLRQFQVMKLISL